MDHRFDTHTQLLLLKMRLLINLEFNVKLELHDADILAQFFDYSGRSCEAKLKQLARELEQHTAFSPTAVAC